MFGLALQDHREGPTVLGGVKCAIQLLLSTRSREFDLFSLHATTKTLIQHLNRKYLPS
jgi:hypothetical protein